MWKTSFNVLLTFPVTSVRSVCKFIGKFIKIKKSRCFKNDSDLIIRSVIFSHQILINNFINTENSIINTKFIGTSNKSTFCIIIIIKVAANGS